MGSGGTLPIELLSFNAIPKGNTVILEWITSSETNNDFFTVERTTDGKNFETIATVTGAGNSTEEIRYAAIDDQPAEGVSYYRLKQTDYDGKFTYSHLAAVRFSKGSDVAINVFPNPSKGESFLTLSGIPEGEEVLVVVYDPFGKESYSKVVMAEQNGILTAIDPQQKLSPGIYLIVASSNNRIYQQKLVITE